MFCLKHTHMSVSKPDPVLVVSTTAISPCLSLWPSAVCRSGTGRVLYTTGRKPSEAACVGWCWVTWRSRRWTSGEDAQCSGCGVEDRYSQHPPNKHINRLLTKLLGVYLQMSMKSWRTLGLKASKSLKIITTGGCCWPSPPGELRFFPGVPLLDFCNLRRRPWWRWLDPFGAADCRSWTQAVLRLLTFVWQLYQSQSVPREQWTLPWCWVEVCLASSSSSSSSSSSVTTVSISLPRTLFINCFNAKKKITCTWGCWWHRSCWEGKWPLTSTLFGLHRGHKRTDRLLEQFRQTLKRHVMIWDIHTWGGLQQ